MLVLAIIFFARLFSGGGSGEDRFVDDDGRDAENDDQNNEYSSHKNISFMLKNNFYICYEGGRQKSPVGGAQAVTLALPARTDRSVKLLGAF